VKDLIKKPEPHPIKELKMEKLSWLWPNRIPLGKISLIVGDPGKGKSLLSLYIAAQVSTGRPWIDTSTPRTPASVLILTAEDDLSDTVGPRLMAAQADLAKICSLSSYTDEIGKRHGLYNLTRDLDVLIQTVKDMPDLKLVIIDPISAYMEGKNENKNAEVREYLTPLADLARNADIAIIGITHLNKNQMTQTANYRVLGSIAFTAAVRAVWLVHQDPENEIGRLFVPSKGNLSKNPTGLSFTIMSTSIPTFDGGTADAPYCAFSPETIHTSAEELLAPIKFEKRSPKKDAATEWLQEYLSDGPKPANEIFNVGLQMGFSKRTLERIKSKLGIQSTKIGGIGGGDGKWEWALRA